MASNLLDVDRVHFLLGQMSPVLALLPVKLSASNAFGSRLASARKQLKRSGEAQAYSLIRGIRSMLVHPLRTGVFGGPVSGVDP